MTLANDYTLDEVADALGMSTSWLRRKVKSDLLEHQKYGHKIKFTPAQVDAIRARYSAQPEVEPITTGRKKRS